MEAKTDIINKLSILLGERVEWKKVIRKGKVKRKLMCNPGFREKDGKCVRMDPKEIIKRSRSAKKAQRKLQANTGKKSALLRKRAKSMRKRGAFTSREDAE